MWKSLLTYPTFGLVDSQLKHRHRTVEQTVEQTEQQGAQQYNHSTTTPTHHDTMFERDPEAELNHILAENISSWLPLAATTALAQTSRAMRDGRGWIPSSRPYRQPYVKKCLQHQWHSVAPVWHHVFRPVAPHVFTEGCASLYSSIIHLFFDFMVGVISVKATDSIISSVKLDIRDTENSSIFQPNLSTSWQFFYWDKQMGAFECRGAYCTTNEELWKTIHKHWRLVFGNTDISTKKSRNEPWTIAIEVNYYTRFHEVEGNKIDNEMDIAYRNAGDLAQEYSKIKTEDTWKTTYNFFHHSILHLAPA